MANKKFSEQDISDAVLVQMADLKPTSKPLKNHKGSQRFEINSDGTKNRKVEISKYRNRNQNRLMALNPFFSFVF